jgi:hypothetical protein
VRYDGHHYTGLGSGLGRSSAVIQRGHSSLYILGAGAHGVILKVSTIWPNVGAECCIWSSVRSMLF